MRRDIPGRWFAVAVLMLAAMVLLIACGKPEPRYQRMPISVYLKRLGSDREATVDRAKEALIAIGEPGVPYILDNWKKASNERRYLLAEVLAGIGPGAKEAVPVLVKELDGLDEKMIGLCAAALGAIGPPAAPAARRMASLLRSSDTSTQVGLLKGLGGIGPAAAEAVPLVMEAAQRDKTRTAAIKALGNMGPKAVEAMKKWLEEGSSSQRMIACEVLSYAGKDASDALPYLTSAFKDKDPNLRMTAVRAIGQAGPDAVVVLDELIRGLDDSDKFVREEVINAIIAIGSDNAKDKVIKALNHPNPRIREGAVKVVSRWQSVREEAKSILINRLADGNVYVQAAAISAMTEMGPTIIPTMRNLLKSSNTQLRFAAARVLGNLGSDARVALPDLIRLRKDRDSLVREEADKAIKKIE